MSVCRKVWNARWGKDPYSSNEPNRSKKSGFNIWNNDHLFTMTVPWNRALPVKPNMVPVSEHWLVCLQTGRCKITHIFVQLDCSHFLTRSHSGSENKEEKTLLTVQEDVVTFTPAAPQWRIMLAGAAHLDGIVHSGLQVQRRPGFSKHRHDLKTRKRKPVGGGWDSQGSISSPIGVTVTCQAGWVVSGEYRTSYLTPVWKFGSVQCRISSASMVCTCERLTRRAGFTGQQKNGHVCYQVLQGLLFLWPPLWLGLLLLVFLGFSVGLFCWWILWVKSQFCISEAKSPVFLTMFSAFVCILVILAEFQPMPTALSDLIWTWAHDINWICLWSLSWVFTQETARKTNQLTTVVTKHFAHALQHSNALLFLSRLPLKSERDFLLICPSLPFEAGSWEWRDLHDLHAWACLALTPRAEWLSKTTNRGNLLLLISDSHLMHFPYLCS